MASHSTITPIHRKPLLVERRTISNHRNVGATDRRMLPLAVVLIQLVLAYEWLISGVNKLANPNFTVALAGNLRQGLSGNPYGWYDAFVRAIVLPHAALFGLLTEVGETAIGLALLAGGVLWILRPQDTVTVRFSLIAAMACVGAAFLSLNYFFQGGTSMPWVNAANAFQEGVDIDILIPLFSLVLAGANWWAAHAAHHTLQSAPSIRRDIAA